MKSWLMAAAAATAVPAAVPAPPPAATSAVPAPAAPAAPAADASADVPEARLPGFAAELSEQPTIDGPSAWAVIPEDRAWAAIAGSTVETRQEARWTYARSLLGRGLSAEAFGVLQVMAEDDPDLTLIDSYRLARGAALAGLGRPVEAMEALVGPGLALNPEACAWRMLALAREGFTDQALQQFACARPALTARPLHSSAPFILAASGAALKAGKPELAINLLRSIEPGAAAADLLRGRAYLALGQAQPARLSLARAEKNGNEEQRLGAEVGGIELAVRGRSMASAQALKRLSQIRYVWRGGDVEERALRLSYQLSLASRDLRGALSAGSALFHYFDLGPEAGPLVASLQKQLANALDPSSGMPLDQALGLYWDFRDLTPLGADGDIMVSQLAGRLEAAGLYARAADLLEHQLFARAVDIAQGPLSVRVARLHILAGQPDRALEAIRRTAMVPYPSEMRWERQRVAAVALTHLGRIEEALAALEEVPNAAPLKAEILWKKRAWGALADAIGPDLPEGGALSDVSQAKILRYAVALAMLHREPELEALGVRYGTAFASLPSGAAFAALTGSAGAVDGAALTKALASIPSASPAGEIADLLEVSPAAAKTF